MLFPGGVNEHGYKMQLYQLKNGGSTIIRELCNETVIQVSYFKEEDMKRDKHTYLGQHDNTIFSHSSKIPLQQVLLQQHHEQPGLQQNWT